MPLEPQNASQQAPPCHIIIPPNISAMLPGFNIRIDPNQSNITQFTVQRHRIMADYARSVRNEVRNEVRSIISVMPVEERRTFFTDQFRNAVIKGLANIVYAIQSNPMYRLDLDKTIVINGLNALQLAAVCGFSDLLRVLFHFGASASIVDCRGNTALRLAMNYYNLHGIRSERRQGVLNDVAMLIGYTQIRTLKTNGMDTFLPGDLEKLKNERYTRFVDELKNAYPEFESLQI